MTPLTTSPAAADHEVSHVDAAPRRVDLSSQRLHFVGIGGCGMSGLARLAARRGAACSGTDMAETDAITTLRDEGISITTGEQSAQTVPHDCDCLVCSAAIRDDNLEVLEAQRRGIKVVKYAQLLGSLMIGQTGVAIAGTHGKSTTTSLLSHVLIECGLDPSFIVGANCPQIGGGSRVGGSDLLIAEACEFARSFHCFFPTHAVILNVEADHLDMYSGIDEIVDAFAQFARLIPRDGSLLINYEMSHRLAITAGLDCPFETIGFAPQADWRIELVQSQEPVVKSNKPVTMNPKVQLHEHDKLVAWWRCSMPGEHMAYNAAVAAITAHRLGASWDQVSAAIGGFRGLDRRMQFLGDRRTESGTISIVDDYGHHPTEIDTTLRALRCHYRPKRVICVFQPHQHSRTRFLLDDFAASFAEADVVIVPHIYFVRDSEEERHTVRAADLVDQLRQRDKEAMHLYPFEAIVKQLELICRGGDLLVTMGAGDVGNVAHQFLGIA